MRQLELGLCMSKVATILQRGLSEEVCGAVCATVSSRVEWTNLSSTCVAQSTGRGNGRKAAALKNVTERDLQSGEGSTAALKKAINKMKARPPTLSLPSVPPVTHRMSCTYTANGKLLSAISAPQSAVDPFLFARFATFSLPAAQTRTNIYRASPSADCSEYTKTGAGREPVPQIPH